MGRASGHCGITRTSGVLARGHAQKGPPDRYFSGQTRSNQRPPERSAEAFCICVASRNQAYRQLTLHTVRKQSSLVDANIENVFPAGRHQIGIESRRSWHACLPMLMLQ